MLQVDLYFAASDVIHSVKFQNPRNELEALHSIMLLIDNSILNSKHLRVDILQDLRNMTLEKINALGNTIKDDTKIVGNFRCDRESRLVHWGEGEGVKTKLEIACKFVVIKDCCLTAELVEQLLQIICVKMGSLLTFFYKYI